MYTIFVARRPINAVAFDLEGTVVDLEPQHFAAHEEVARELGLDLERDKFIEECPNFIGGPDKVIMEQLQALAKRRGASETSLPSIEDMLVADKTHFRRVRDISDIVPREGFIPFLGQLTELKIPVAIGSLTTREDAEVIFTKSGLKELFDQERIVLAEDVRKLKPDPEVYQRTAESMGVFPRNQLVFEDSHNGIRSARAADSLAVGMPVVHQDGVIARLTNEGAIAVFKDWREVTLNSLRSIEGPRRIDGKVEGTPPAWRR